MTSVEKILSGISSPSHFIHAAEELKSVQIPKLTLNILKILRNILGVNNKDIRQFNGLIIVFKIFKRGLDQDLTNSDWSMLHGEFSKSVIATFESILYYKNSNIIKQSSFCQFVLQVGQLLFPQVYKIESVCQDVINEGFNIITALICLSDLNIAIRKSLFLLFKPIITKADSRQRKAIMESSEPMLSCLANLVITCGDYEMQEGLIEILMRFSLASKKKLNKISLWFHIHMNDVNLIKILDYSNFDSSSREFLNALNSAAISDAKVITLSALEAYANGICLKKPSSSKYRELWIDFCTSTATIHTVCDMNGSAWLRLSVEQPNVKKVRCSKRTVNESNGVQFLVELNKPMRVNSHSPEIHVAALTLIFLKSPKIVELQESFFKKYYKEVYEEPKFNLLNSLGSSRGSDLSASNKGCLCDCNSTVSSIHTSSSFCKKQICHKGGKECEIVNKTATSNPHFLATSTPKAPLRAHHLLNMRKENTRQNETLHLKNMCESDIMNNEFLYNKFCNPNKWQKGSLIKYYRNTLLPDEDRKFKEMCEKKLAEAKNNQSHSNHFPSLNETDRNAGLSNLRGKEFLDKEINSNESSGQVVDINEVRVNENKLLSKVEDQNTLSKEVEKNEASDDSPYMLISSKGGKSFVNPVSMDSLGSQKNHLKMEAPLNDKTIGCDSKLQKMRRLLTQGMSSQSKFTLPLSEKTPISQTFSTKENKKFVLQPSKFNFSRTFCTENINSDASNLPYLKQKLPSERIFSKSELIDHSDKNKIPLTDFNSQHQDSESINALNSINSRKITDITEPSPKMSKMSEPIEQGQKNSKISRSENQDEPNFKNSHSKRDQANSKISLSEQDQPNSKVSKSEHDQLNLKFSQSEEHDKPNTRTKIPLSENDYQPNSKISTISQSNKKDKSNSKKSQNKGQDKPKTSFPKLSFPEEQYQPNSVLSKISLPEEQDRLKNKPSSDMLPKNEFLKETMPVGEIDEVKQSKTSDITSSSESMKPSNELESSRKLQSCNLTKMCVSSKKNKSIFRASSRKKFSPEKKSYDLSSSFSNTDQGGFSPNLKSKANYCASSNERGGKLNSSKKVELKLLKPTLREKRKNLSHQALSPNNSIHCKMPRKTYGQNSRTQNILETTSEKIFRDLQSSSKKSKLSHVDVLKKDTKKRKLFNPNSSLEESFSLEKENADVSYSSPNICNKMEKEEIHLWKQNLGKNSGKNRKFETKSCQSKIMKEIFNEETLKPQFRRKSLRNKPKVKYVEPSSSNDSANKSSTDREVSTEETFEKSELNKNSNCVSPKNTVSGNSRNIDKTTEKDQCSQSVIENQSMPCGEKIIEEENITSQRSAGYTSNYISPRVTNESSNLTGISSELTKSKDNCIEIENENCQLPSVKDKVNFPDYSNMKKHPISEADVSPKLQAVGSEEEAPLSEFHNEKVPFMVTNEEINKEEHEDLSTCSKNGSQENTAKISKLLSPDLDKKCAEFKEDAVKIVDSLMNCCDDFIKFILNK